MSVEEKIREIIALILEIDGNEIEEDSAVGDFDNWDSIRHLRIIAEIEKAFGITFSVDALMDMEDFGDIVKATEERI